MKYIYLDNFRGFSKEFIPLVDMNFFVGENSTGKSSVMSVIDLLLGYEFWSRLEFNNKNHELGAFEDILSRKAEGAKEFTIGIIEEFKNKEKSFTRYYVISFHEKEGMPSLSKFTFGTDNITITIDYNNVDASYKYCKQAEAIKSEDALSVFKRAVTYHNNSNIASEKLPRPSYLKSVPFDHLSIMHISSIVTEFIQRHNKEAAKLISSVRYGRIFRDEPIWIAPIRTKPKRTYDGYVSMFNSEGEHTPYKLKRILSNAEVCDDFKRKLQKIGKKGALFEGVCIKGYGDNSAPFELQVLLDKQPFRINTVGYGVSQVLPIIVELLNKKQVQSTYLIQQPEVHLHPKAQAALGELIFNVVQKGARLCVETHSDYIIDRYRIMCRKSRKTKATSQILFFERMNGCNRVSHIDILKDGSISPYQPQNYRKFFIKEEMQILGI